MDRNFIPQFLDKSPSQHRVRYGALQVGWAKGIELVKLARRDGQKLRLCNLVAQSPADAEGGL